MTLFKYYDKTTRDRLATIVYRLVQKAMLRDSMIYFDDPFTSEVERKAHDAVPTLNNRALEIAEQSPSADPKVLQWAAKSNCEEYAGSCSMAAKYGAQVDSSKVAEAAHKEREFAKEIRQSEREENEIRRQSTSSVNPVVEGILEGLQNVAQQPPPTIIVPPRPTPAPHARIANSSRPVYITPPAVIQPPKRSDNLIPCGTAIVLPNGTTRRGPDCPGTTASTNSHTPGGSNFPGGISTPGGRPSGSPPSGGGHNNVANGACTNVNALVSFTTSRPTGPGHCAGEITGTLTNRSGQSLVCRFTFYSNGIKTADSGGGSIAPGRTISGEAGGIWSCGADTIKYACFADTADAYGCPVNF